MLHKKGLALFGLVIVALVYQNFDYVSAWKVTLIPINENARSHHAKELLGKKYKGSAAQMVEGSSGLGASIFNEVYRNLPKKHKSSAKDLTAAILKLADRYKVDPVFVMAVIKTESSFNPLARGSAGEIGLMQLKPSTAEWIAHKTHQAWHGPRSLENPVVNVTLGIAYFDLLRDKFDGKPHKYISGYNLGAKKVCGYAAGEIPRQYSTKVMHNYQNSYKRMAVETTLNIFAIQ